MSEPAAIPAEAASVHLGQAVEAHLQVLRHPANLEGHRVAALPADPAEGHLELDRDRAGVDLPVPAASAVPFPSQVEGAEGA